jgi:hypothetical protein
MGGPFFVAFTRARLECYEKSLHSTPRPTSISLEFLYRYVPAHVDSSIGASIGVSCLIFTAYGNMFC